jgi:hypothetical protein
MLTRRYFIGSGLGFVAAGSVARAAGDGAVDIDWSDLAPQESGIDMSRLRALGVVEHGQLSTPFDQERGGQVTREFDGRRVRIPGFLVPLDFSGAGVTDFLLVPYVGACIHVPPPPPNQLILVTAAEPYESDGLFEAVYVTGTMGTVAATTELAEVGYAIDGATVTPYD